MVAVAGRSIPVTAIIEAPANPALTDVQALLRPLLGTRYQLIMQLNRPGTSTSSPSWNTYLAHDTSLRRKVVLRIANREHGDTRDLHARVQRAMHAARLNAHLVAAVYDAVIQGDPSMMAPPATKAVIIGEHFEGETLAEAIARGAGLNQTAILAALAHRVAHAADAGISFGVLRPENVVLTKDGPAIAALPAGSVADLGPTSLDSLAAGMRVNPLERALRRMLRGIARPAHAA